MPDEQKITPILIDIPLPIETPRLLLRPVQPGDGAAMFEAQQETWESLKRWMDWTEEGLDPDRAEANARKGYARYILREDLWLTGIEKETGRPVIWTGLHRPDWDNRGFSIGYWVRQSVQGQGYATESTNALIRYAFNALAARRVTIGHAEGNEASRRVIEKLGFTLEGTLQQVHMLPDGRYVDELTYARMDGKDLPPLDVRWGPP